MPLKVTDFAAYSRPVCSAGEAGPVEAAGDDPEPLAPRDGTAPLPLPSPQPATPSARTTVMPTRAALGHLRALITSSSIMSMSSSNDSQHPNRDTSHAVP